MSLAVLAVSMAVLSPEALAALPQVTNLQVQVTGALTWDALPGTAGYNVYRGDVAGLRTGNYGACLVGSVQGQSFAVPGDPVPIGTAVFFLVDGFDETGEGQVADAPAANPSPRCVPARRIMAFTPDGDPGDGLEDGTSPLLNPDALLQPGHDDTSGVLLHSGEFLLSAVDLVISERNAPGGFTLTGILPEEGDPHGSRLGVSILATVDSTGGITGGYGSGGGQGKEHFHDISISGTAHKRRPPITDPGDSVIAGTGAAPLPPFFRNCVAGGHYKEGPINFRHAGGGGGAGGIGVCLPSDQSGYEDDPPPQPATGGVAFGRTYRSQIRYSGPLGPGWDFPANARLAPSGSSALYFDGTGRRELYVRLDATRFAPTRGRYALLLQNADGSFTLREPDGTLQNFHAFDGSNRTGVLESTQDRVGNRSTFLYDSQGLMTTVVDPLGRSIAYAYDANGRIVSITDFAGRQVVYGYDANGNLTSARSPIITGTPNGNDFPGGRTTTYSYSSGFADERLNHNLIGVIRPDEAGSGTPALQISYGSDAAAFNFDRVVSQTIGGMNASGVAAGGTLTFSYQSLNPGANPADPTLPRRQATVFDRNGNRTDYVHNANGNCLARTDFTNRGLRSGEPDYTTQYGYDSDGELILVLRPQGDQMQFAYDKPGADRYREGNLIMVRSVADPLSLGGRGDGHGGESNDLVRTFTYEQVFNQIASSTEPRGNDPTYLPQNGGANTPGRYTRSWAYDYQEGDPAINGINAYAGRFGISLTGGTFALGDLNGDGSTTQTAGNLVKISDPAIQLDPTSVQAAIAGGPLQVIETRLEWNGHGQPTAVTDAEQNRHTFQYNPETDPDGDGVPSPPPADGRVLDPTSGGFLKIGLIDTVDAPGRDNATRPPPVGIQFDLKYDPLGNLAALIDGRGVETRFINNALGEVVEVREAAATADGSGPDGTPPTGRGETGLTPFGFLLRHAYDANGNVVDVQREDRGGTRGVGLFVELHRTLDILDDVVQTDQPSTASLTLTTQFRYDANQNLTRVTEPDGNSHDRAYDERDLLLSTTRGSLGPLGGTPSTRLYAHDGDGNIAHLTDGRGGLTDYLYDGHDRLARTIDPIGGTTDDFYDPADNLVRLLSRGTAGGPTPGDRSGSGNVDLADQRGLYDEMGRRIRDDRVLFVPAGVIPARPPMVSEGPLVPGDGAINTIFEYDRLSRHTFRHDDSSALARLDYDGAGRAIKTTDPAGDTIEGTYDAGGNLVESVEPELSSKPGPVSEQFLTTYFYDALGRGTMSVDNLGETWRSIYDSLGALTIATDANGPAGGSINRRSPGHTGTSVAINNNGNVTRNAYDGAGRLLSTVQVLTATGKGDGTTAPQPDTSNPANPDGLITVTTSWSGDALPLQTLDDKGNATSYAYDNLDRRTRVTRADATSDIFNYDAEDHLVMHSIPNGATISAFFDPAGRLSSRSIEAPPTVGGTTSQTFEYDGLWLLTRAFDNNSPSDSTDDANVTFLHDSLGRLLEEAQGAGGAGGGATRYSDLAWQAADLLTGLTYPSGDQVLYGYDGAERLRTTNDMMHPELMATFEYFGLGRLLTRQSGNGVQMTFLDDTGTLDTGYDGVGRPVRLRHLDSSNALLAGFDYRYDRVGNRTAARRLHDTNASGNARGNLYLYDSANRLLSSQEAYLDSGFNLASPLLDSESWALDGPGNWANLTRNGSLYLDTPNNLNEYDEPQCCGTHTDDGVADDFLDLASTPLPDGLNLTYDKNGNQTSTVRQSLTYDFADRPAAARTSLGSLVAAYAYDGLGRRTKRQVTGGEGTPGTETYAYAGSLFPDAIEEGNATGGFMSLAAYGPGGGCLWHVHSDGTTQYALEDAPGSIVALTPGSAAGSGGGILERVVYDPFGKPTFESPGNVPLVNPTSGTFLAQSQYGNEHLFRMMHYDPELGARGTSVNTDFGGLYAGGSDFNPNEGRFMSGDYEFAGGNPVSGFAPLLSNGKPPVEMMPAGKPPVEMMPGSVDLQDWVMAKPPPQNRPAWGRRIPGLVNSPAGDEVHTDKYGRVKVHFHWFREGQKDNNSSCWIRETRTWTGKQGSVRRIPRFGQEVVVDFLEGDPDRPLIVDPACDADPWWHRP
jgi:YD repeat-containing protein